MGYIIRKNKKVDVWSAGGTQGLDWKISAEAEQNPQPGFAAGLKYRGKEAEDISTDEGINESMDVNIDTSESADISAGEKKRASVDESVHTGINGDEHADAAAGTDESTGEDRNAVGCHACMADSEGGAGCCSSCGRKKKRTEKEYRDMMNRLNRIEGQVRGIKRMVDEDAYCPDILIQVSAIQAALNSFNKVLLANHIRTCVAEDIRAGKDEVIDELVRTMMKLMK